MPDLDPELAVLSRALDQATRMLEEVTSARMTTPTPCRDWTTADLIDHMVMAPAKFAAIVRGEKVDWSVQSHVDSAPATAFRTSADELLAAWRQEDSRPSMGPDWHTAEIAVHTYDLARALDLPTDVLDAEVAERGLAFMRANLKPEIRSQAFGPERPAPEGADPYQRIAAFAGRHL